jgi:3-hydroxyacyl-CoA dehydrogenase / enoyl-CoA hydratase / 3-hydroxybutyryl-CoA epimerase
METTGSNIFRLEETQVPQSPYKIWKLIFDLPGEKVNKLSRLSMEGFEKSVLPQLESMAKEGRIDALILVSGKPNNFIAGADIDMILATKNATEAEELSREGHRMMNRWEDLPFPTIAAINGTCLGGGCELSLASTAIVMSDNPGAKIGVPEVNLGIIPGSGGCVRMPRKVGIATALDLILTGKTLNGPRAIKSG